VYKKYLHADGIVEQKPNATELKNARRRGFTIQTRGQLCAACLVGDWGRNGINWMNFLCSDCMWLDHAVTQLAGAEPSARTTRTDHNLATARSFRTQRLARVFAQAEALGVPTHDASDPYNSTDTSAGLAWDDITQYGLISRSHEDRVIRFAEWLAYIDPEAYAARAVVLADVAPLASALGARERRFRQGAARRQLSRAMDDLRKGFMLIATAPHSLVAAMSDIIASHVSRVNRRPP
jgi:hypothetical protein